MAVIRWSSSERSSGAKATVSELGSCARLHVGSCVGGSKSWTTAGLCNCLEFICDPGFDQQPVQLLERRRDPQQFTQFTTTVEPKQDTTAAAAIYSLEAQRSDPLLDQRPNLLCSSYHLGVCPSDQQNRFINMNVSNCLYIWSVILARYVIIYNVSDGAACLTLAFAMAFHCKICA